MNPDVIDRLRLQLGEAEADLIISLAKRIERIENVWVDKVGRFYKTIGRKAAKSLLETGRIPSAEDIDFDRIFTEFWFEVQIEGFKSVEHSTPIPKRMAQKKRTLRDLIRERNAWRKGTYQPKRPKGYAKALKKEYLEKINKYWRKHADSFIEGEVYTQEEAFKKLTDDLNLGEARAQTIIRTETTRYYNEVRKEFYDQIPDVTHYLFISIRDKRTTPYCKQRDGLIYKKNSKYSWEIPPPCHYNCRSEILPLDPDNPKHKRLIDDKTMSRDNNSPTPLPKGFKKR